MASSRKGAKSPRNAMSVLLSSGLLNGLGSSINHDKLAVVSEGKEKKTKAIYSGYLLKLSGKTVLSGGNWKRKFFVLEKKRLAYYESEEVWNAGSRASGFISLEFYDLCEEKETRKATNVFFVGSSDKNLFENTRHYFSAETLPEMTAWMSHIRSALKDVRRSQRGTVSHRQNTDLEIQVQRRDEKKRTDGRESPSNKKKERKKKMETKSGRDENERDENERDENERDENGRNESGRDESTRDESRRETGPTLQPLTKARVRGPTGRKLPTNHRATLLGGDTRSKSNSLTTLDASSREDSRSDSVQEKSDEFDQALFVNYDGMKNACSSVDSSTSSPSACSVTVDEVKSDDQKTSDVPVSRMRKFFKWLKTVFGHHGESQNQNREGDKDR